MEVNKKEFISLTELLSQMNLDLSRIDITPGSSQSLSYDFEIQATEFIKFAELDLQQNSTHGLVNALSNAKRAIDCQVDTVLGCFGLLSRRNFPQKMDVLRSLGMITPRIVNKVVKARNYLEHEFRQPDREQVEDAVDIATLFSVSLDKALRNFTDHFYIGTIVNGTYDDLNEPFQDKLLDIAFDDENICYELSGVIFDKPPTQESRNAKRTASAIIKPNEKGYSELIRLAFCFDEAISQDDFENIAAEFVKAHCVSKT